MEEKYKKLFYKALEDIETLKMRLKGNEIRLETHRDYIRNIAKYLRKDAILFIFAYISIFVILFLVFK